ncbi:hypothetical protein [Alicyclobacillus dauci]|uniref:Uncharacterized protein n=1 Tax=Alicyclobacillus dauci TaxID=1475485 RepID=A0ABY6Z9B4_9BACL|nr:hypothetical protein [Alicyclobacillus dauci]WAH39488.1 hypothetical protein NZD86_24275 [Alicyclobacillus dauci]WAH39548.1 hypothetical protein NZD86_23975 [Alicyclobacillus dauci]
MKKRTAVVLIGSIAAGTVTAATLSVMWWTIIPISIWSMGTAVIGGQTMNVLRVKNGQLQPVKVYKSPEQSDVLRRMQ